MRAKLFNDHMFPFNIDNFTRTMRANVVGPALVANALLPLLRKADRRVLMNMTSTMGSIGSDMGAKLGTYSMSKTTLNMAVRPSYQTHVLGTMLKVEFRAHRPISKHKRPQT